MPVTEQPIRYEVVDGVAWLTINRPEARNALNMAVRDGLFAGVHRFNADREAKVLVLTGAGDAAFCAGGDLKEMAEVALQVPPPDFLPQFGRNIEVAKPTIAAVNGLALAGGFLLAQMCDLCVAAQSARFAITEVRVGRGAPWAAALPWLIPPRAAMEILLTGDLIDADRAERIGLVNRVVPDAELRDADPATGPAHRRQRAAVGARGQENRPAGRRAPAERRLPGGRTDLGTRLHQPGRPGGTCGLQRKAGPGVEGMLMSTTSQRNGSPVAGDPVVGDPAAATPGTTKAAVLQTVVADLAAETDSLVTILAGLGTAAWDASTPARGWTIRDQVTHLAFFDDATLLAVNDPAAFVEQRAELLALGDGFADVVAERYRRLSGEQCLAWFSRSRAALLAAYRDTQPRARLPWYGPDMGPASSATGRLMETWAHGQDVADATGQIRAPSRRLRHVADLGVRTLAFCFRLRGRPVPADAGPGRTRRP